MRRNINIRVIGYVILAIGIILLVINLEIIKQLNDVLPETMKKNVGNRMGIFIGVVVFIAGIFLVLQKTKKKEKEVPIYKGKEVVGFRRM